MAKTYLMQLLYSRFLMTMPPRQCLLPSLCGECFPGCLLPSLCGECIGIGLGFGTHGFGFGHCARWKFCDTGNRPLPHLPKKTRKNGTTQQNTTQRNTKQSTRKQRKKESPFLPPSRAGEKLEAGISRPLIASSSSRGIKARGRDLQVAGIGELDTNNKQHKQHKQQSVDSKIVPVSSIALDGWDPIEGGNATSPLHSRGSPTKGTKSKLKTYAGGHHDAPRNEAWIQRLSRFPQ